MEISGLGMQIVIVFLVILFVWLFLRVFRKTVKVLWKVLLVCLVLLALSFVLPAVREWVFNLLEDRLIF